MNSLFDPQQKRKKEKEEGQVNSIRDDERLRRVRGQLNILAGCFRFSQESGTRERLNKSSFCDR